VIEQAAREEGMRTMYEDGLIKALSGTTTIEEVMRVCQES
jgi:general secretion pathway protein E